MKKIYDLIGVGIGPSNLSTAALLDPYSDEISALFFDSKKEFSWYPGMLFPDAKMQVSFLKDLVTMVDPSSEFSFLNFLKKTGRLYMFAAKGTSYEIRRCEFEQYFLWVTKQLQNLRFSSNVQSITYVGDHFEVTVNEEKYYSKHISLGVGKSANIPACAEPLMDGDVFHSNEYLTSGVDLDDRDVMIVGSGQSAAEIVLHLMRDQTSNPEKIYWVSSSYNLIQMEDSPFANELYTPSYSEHFFKMDASKKDKLIRAQKYTSDGISSSTMMELYEEIYQQRYINNTNKIDFYLHSTLKGLKSDGKRYTGVIEQKDQEDSLEVKADVVILCTGLSNKKPVCLNGFEDQILLSDDKFCINHDFSLKTKEPLKGKVFIHNGAQHVRGVADPNLSLLAWRSGLILNSVIGREIYDVTNDHSVVNWSGAKKDCDLGEINVGSSIGPQILGASSREV